MKRIYILGDSHTHAIKQANERQDGNEFDIEVHWIKSQKSNGSVSGSLTKKDARDKVSLLNSEDAVVFSILGTQHNITGLIKHEIPFTTSGLRLDSCDYIPENVLIAFFLEKMLSNKFIDKIAEHTDAKLYHLSTPPPKGINSFLVEKTSKYRGNQVTEESLNPAALRGMLWQLEMKALDLYLAQKGIGRIPVPQNAIIEDKFLDSKFYGQDATHANSQYGELVLSEIIKELK